MAVKRGPRKNPNKIHLAGNVRKRSAYSAFKKEFLASDKGIDNSRIKNCNVLTSTTVLKTVQCLGLNYMKRLEFQNL